MYEFDDFILNIAGSVAVIALILFISLLMGVIN